MIRWAASYDLLVWLMTFGRERRLRERFLEPARLRPGDSVLDVGCGTGSLAITASRKVGPTGSVHGVDAAPAMIARAMKKARRAGVDVRFQNALAQSLPFAEASFDVVLCTVMLHHLPGEARREAVREMRRVLKPGGRVLLIDFARGSRHGLRALVHGHRHGHVPPRDLIDLATGAGLRVVDSGPLGTWELQFALGELAA